MNIEQEEIIRLGEMVDRLSNDNPNAYDDYLLDEYYDFWVSLLSREKEIRQNIDKKEKQYKDLMDSKLISKKGQPPSTTDKLILTIDRKKKAKEDLANFYNRPRYNTITISKMEDLCRQVRSFHKQMSKSYKKQLNKAQKDLNYEIINYVNMKLKGLDTEAPNYNTRYDNKK